MRCDGLFVAVGIRDSRSGTAARIVAPSSPSPRPQSDDHVARHLSLGRSRGLRFREPRALLRFSDPVLAAVRSHTAWRRACGSDRDVHVLWADAYGSDPVVLHIERAV